MARRLLSSIASSIAALALFACGSPSSTSQSGPTQPSSAPSPAFAASDVCAGDSWVPQLLGDRPSLTNTMRLAEMKRLLGAHAPSMDRVQMDYLYELDQVKHTMVEMYEWRSRQQDVDKSLLTVARGVFGDPRQLRDGETFLYGAPVPIGNGVMEYPPSQDAATKQLSFRPHGGRALYTFPDGTWVRADAWMMQRVRGAFASGPPPLPPLRPDVAWEVCASLDAVDGRSGVWGVKPERGVLRFLVGRDPANTEMVFRFASPGEAIRADGEQRVRCSQPQGSRRDKGVFDLIPPCAAVGAGRTYGPLLHYVFQSGL